MPYIGRSTDGFGVRNRFLYLASASDTSVSGADANGATLTFTDGAYVDVYLNGVLLKAGTDYNTNTANTIAGLSALAANDEVTVIVYDVFTVGDMVSATSGGTFIGGVTFNGTVTFGSTVSGLDVNGTEIILDADGDTTITADTDDQIDIKIAGQDDFQFTANTFTAQSGSTIAAQALTATTVTASGIIKTDDTTDATSTTDGSLQTDGGLSVAKDAVIGNDLLMKSDSSAIKFGADSEMLLTHSADEGLKLTQTAAAGALLTLGTTSTSVSDDAFIGGIDFASGSSPTVNARMHARQEGTSENGGKIEFETRREGGSLLKSAKIDDEGRFSVASDGLVGRNQIVSQYTVSVGTSATSIANTTRFRTYGTFFVVNGRDHLSSANRFVDILVASLNGSVVLVSGNAVRGSPASRTYSNTSERLNVTMGAGSYSICVMAFDFNNSGNSLTDAAD